MGYVLDDGWDNCTPVARAGNAAFGVYVRCGIWVARNLTDGFIPGEIATAYGSPELTRKLLSVGLWEAVEGGYLAVDYLGLNQKAEKVRSRRANDARRKALFRDPILREAVRKRDGDHCRYCGVKVRWNDRKGSAGGTYDHVDPDGENSLENVVVCCRGCNSSKRDRTPEEAGMTLLPPPGLGQTQTGSKSGTRPGLGVSVPPYLPSKEGKGGRSPASQGDASVPADAHAPLDEEDPKPVDWRAQKAFGTTPDPVVAETAHRGAAAVRALVKKPSRFEKRPGPDDPIAALDAKLAELTPASTQETPDEDQAQAA